MITQKELKQIFSYNQDTGEFRYKEPKQGRKLNKICGKADRRKSGLVYWALSIYGKHYMAHRMAWLYVYGSYPEGQVDHIDGDPLNNKISNLRCVTNLENNMNKRLYSSNTSGVNGISWDSRANKWEVQIRNKTKKRRIGRYESLIDAVCARKNADRLYGYDINHGKERVINVNII